MREQLARNRIRDVPASCACKWHWYDVPGRWVRTIWNAGCPWHTGRPA